jgi:hypothetical protein|tara:strand:+ start:205 stop:492 length:288 start_codon:yes stop_codon:yes gene_type:complete
MKDSEFTYRGFKIVEDEHYYTLYIIGKKKRRDYHKGKVINPANLDYQDFFGKDDENLKGKNKLDYIFKYIDNFIKEKKKDPAYQDNVITLLERKD